MTDFDALAARVQDLEDQLLAGLPLDVLPLRDLRSALIENGAPLDLSILALAGQSIDTRGTFSKVAAGAASVVYTASATSATTTVPHGLPTVPTKVYAFPAAPLNEFTVLYEAAVADVTNIYIAGHQAGGFAVTNTQNFNWLALV